MSDALSNWPIYRGDGVSVAVTSASQAVLVAATPDALAAEDVMIDNPGPSDVFVKAGNSASVATVNSLRVPAGSLQPYRKGAQASHVALVCRAGESQAVVVHVGDGQ